MKNKRTKACEIPTSVRRLVNERDSGCIFCLAMYEIPQGYRPEMYCMEIMRSDANAHDNDNEYDNDLKEKDSFGVSKESVSASPQPAVAIPLKDGSLYSIPESDLKEYQALYPGLDVVHECQKAARWCRDNPARQKTRQGVKRFLGSWLSRAAADHARNGTSPVQNGIAAPKPNRFHNFDQRGTDYDALMRIVN